MEKQEIIGAILYFERQKEILERRRKGEQIQDEFHDQCSLGISTHTGEFDQDTAEFDENRIDISLNLLKMMLVTFKDDAEKADFEKGLSLSGLLSEYDYRGGYDNH